jgi:uridine kinase
LLAEHLSTLASGLPIDEPGYLFDRHTRSTEPTNIEPRAFLILEGILALHAAPIRELLGLKVFVSTSGDECLRRLERDIAERGRSRESVLRQYEDTVWPMAQRYVLPTREFADLVVSGEQPLDNSVAKVIAQASTCVASLYISTQAEACASFSGICASVVARASACVFTDTASPNTSSPDSPLQTRAMSATPADTH